MKLSVYNIEITCGFCGNKKIRPRAWIKHRPNATLYCSKICFYESKKGKKHTEEHKKKLSYTHKGERNAAWKGGKYVGSDGYVHIRLINEKCYVREHQLVMEAHIGRKLIDGENVHHINGVKTDNRLANLMLLTRSEHQKIHRKKQCV